MSAITVYTAPRCVQCRATKRKLDALGADYTEVNVREDQEAHDYVISLGYTGAPVVVTGDEHWSGFRPEKLAAVVAAS